jgi:exopolyphosphatase/pppGpp-phosphohydrolase
LGTLLGKFRLFLSAGKLGVGKSGTMGRLANWMSANHKGSLTKANVTALTADDIESFKAQATKKDRETLSGAMKAFCRFCDAEESANT